MRKQFTAADQDRFSALSGDHNPLHTDPLAARRLMFGGVVVHGVHLLLWSLDRLVESDGFPRRLRTVRCVFESGVRVGDTVECSFEAREPNGAHVRVLRSGELVARAEVTWDPGVSTPPENLGLSPLPRGSCREVHAEELAGMSGQAHLSLKVEQAEKLFPYLARNLPSDEIAVLLAATRIVGMECPGLHSVFSELRLDFEQRRPVTDIIGYRVTRYDARFRLASLELDATGIHGELKAFLRPPPTSQPGMEDMEPLVEPNEFRGYRALVVGGSRGLGEVASKLIALGGGDVRLTYRQGRADAARVSDEIRGRGGSAHAHCYDVLGSVDSLDTALADWHPTHLYYFATPFIFQASRKTFSYDLFLTFTKVYVDAFARLFHYVNQGSLESVLYPSSVALDNPPVGMSEYVGAKHAGETLCGLLSRTNKSVQFLVPRLPRLATDQTATVLTIPSEDPVEQMLGLLRTRPIAS